MKIVKAKQLVGQLGLFFLVSLLGQGAVLAADDTAQDQRMIERYSNGLGAGEIAQVSSVSELSDVDPNNFAFQALKSLVERYGCIEGFPSKVYQGNKALTRYEFAAGLNACLEKVNELIAAGTADKVSKDDLAALSRLQEEFKAELATLRGRVDALEAKTKELESQQFSTTTKLDGSVIMAITGGGAGSDVAIGGAFGGLTGSVFDAEGCGGQSGVTGGFSASLDGFCGTANGGTATRLVPSSTANTTFVARTRLNLRTTFSGKDDLSIRLSGVTGQDLSSVYGRGSSTDPGSLFYAGTADASISQNTAVPTNGLSAVVFDKIRYTTPLFGDNFRVYVGPRLQLFEIIDNNSFASNEETDFSATVALKNQLITRTIALPIVDSTGLNYLNQDIGFAGPGFGFDWALSNQFALRGSFIASAGGQSFGFGNGGLLGGSTTLATELEFLPSATSAIRLQYSRFIRNFPAGSRPLFPSVTGGFFPTFGAGDNLVSDNFGVNAEWAITPYVALFGRYGFGTSTLGFTGNPADFGDGLAGSKNTFSADASSWQVGVAFPDLLAVGNTGAISVGQPPRATRTSITNNYRLNGLNTGTELDIEAYYSIRVNERFSITPDVLFISQPGNISSNPTIFVGTVRGVFSF